MPLTNRNTWPVERHRLCRNIVEGIAIFAEEVERYPGIVT